MVWGGCRVHFANVMSDEYRLTCFPATCCNISIKSTQWPSMVRWLSGGLVPFRMVVCSAKPGEPSGSGRILACTMIKDEFQFLETFRSQHFQMSFTFGFSRKNLETFQKRGNSMEEPRKHASDFSQPPASPPLSAPLLRSLTWPLGCPEKATTGALFTS